MEPQFQSSFIPRKSVTADTTSFNTGTSNPPIGIFSLIANVMIVITIFACIGLFAYSKILSSQISQKHSEIVKAKDAFQIDTIQALISASQKLSSAEELLNKHTAPSEIFSILQTLALKRVRFGDFTYKNKNGSVSITMQVEAESYNAMVQQDSVLSHTNFLFSPVFSDFKILENGHISAKFTSDIDSSQILYTKLLNAGSVDGQNTFINQGQDVGTTSVKKQP